MDIKARILNLLSRKFLAPIIAAISFAIWQQWLQMIPINIFALLVGTLLSIFLAVEGIKDIIIAINSAAPKA